MEKLLIILEKADNNYSAYVPELDGCIATGESIIEIKTNISDAVAFHLKGMADEGIELPEKFRKEYEFEYKVDVASLFEWFSGILTKSGLSKLTGLNQSLISQYANGFKKPSEKQRSRISEAIHQLGEELLEIRV